MTSPRYRFLAELTLADGVKVGSCPIAPDWYPADESLSFISWRRTGIVPSGESASIEPIWDHGGPPYVRAIRARIFEGRAEELEAELPITYFQSEVSEGARQVAEGSSFVESDLNYRITAFTLSDNSSAEPIKPGEWGLKEVFTSPVSGERPLSQYLANAKLVDTPGENGRDDFPVFINLAILHQAQALKETAGENETGGILVGYLWKDCDSTELFAEVTALVPARHTVGKSTRLTFSPQTWDAVHTAIALRGRQEIFLGWYHSHPSRFWCKCKPEKQKNCPLGKQFFSSEDLALHRTVFSKAFHVALVSGDRPLPEGGWEVVHSLYGWRNGMVASRGFHYFSPK